MQHLKLGAIIIQILLARPSSGQSNSQQFSDFYITKTTSSKSDQYQKNIPAPIVPLNIGDIIPDINFKNVLNYKSNSINLSDFRGKLLILDFWSTYCAACIKLFPKMMDLQSKFKDKIAIVTVGFNVMHNEEIESFVRNSKGQNMHLTLPTIVQMQGEKIISELFPHDCVPHEIWINEEGRIVAITDASAVSERNIESMLSKNPLKLPLKPPTSLKTMDWNTPFLLGSLEESPRNIKSAFSRFNDTIRASSNPFGLQHDSTYWRLYEVNVSMMKLYKYAYQNLLPDITKKNFILEGDKSKYFLDNSDLQQDADNWDIAEFNKNNLFCYELVMPKRFTQTELFEQMIQDLDAFFGINSKIEKRKIDCLALINLDSSRIPNRSIANKHPTNPRYIENMPAHTFINVLESQRSRENRPILDHTHRKSSLTLELPEEGWQMINDIKKTRTILNSAGYDLVEVKKESTVVVLSKK